MPTLLVGLYLFIGSAFSQTATAMASKQNCVITHLSSNLGCSANVLYSTHNFDQLDTTTITLCKTCQELIFENIASSTVVPVFECSDVIGHVFDDYNANGHMDDGESGLPDVRLITLSGVLITTDSEGRYQVPCATIYDPKIGSNYLLKLDTRTLPRGYTLTIENPRDVRVKKGNVVKLNFGATLAHDVTLDLTGRAFDQGTTELKSKWAARVDELTDVLLKLHANLKIVYHRSDEPAALAAERVTAVNNLVQSAWKKLGGNSDLTVISSFKSVKWVNISKH